MLKKLKLTDYIIILLAFAALAAGFLTAYKKKSFANLPIEKESQIMFDVMFRGVSLSGKSAPFKTGDNAFITIRNVPYTKLKITAVDGSPRMTYIPAKNGKGVQIAEDVSVPGLYDFVIRLEDKAKKTPDGWVIGGNKIKMGMPVVIEGELYRYQGAVSNIFEVNETAEEENK